MESVRLNNGVDLPLAGLGALGTDLPRQDVQTTAAPGDLMLYAGSSLVIFYGSNTWAYTPLGRITDRTGPELEALLGGEGVTAVLSLTAGGTP